LVDSAVVVDMVVSWQMGVVRPAGAVRSARKYICYHMYVKTSIDEKDGAFRFTAEHAEDAENHSAVLSVLSVLSGERAEHRVR
jgi:hypothetical protein